MRANASPVDARRLASPGHDDANACALRVERVHEGRPTTREGGELGLRPGPRGRPAALQEIVHESVPSWPISSTARASPRRLAPGRGLGALASVPCRGAARSRPQRIAELVRDAVWSTPNPAPPVACARRGPSRRSDELTSASSCDARADRGEACARRAGPRGAFEVLPEGVEGIDDHPCASLNGVHGIERDVR